MLHDLASAWLRYLGGKPCFRIYGKAKTESDWRVIDIFATHRRDQMLAGPAEFTQVEVNVAEQVMHGDSRCRRQLGASVQPAQDRQRVSRAPQFVQSLGLDEETIQQIERPAHVAAPVGL